jgi:hypothetical protein
MKMPTQMPSGRSRCFCGVPIDIKGVDAHIRSAHVKKAAELARRLHLS